MRAAYRCPCDGHSHRAPGRKLSRRAAAVRGELNACEELTGTRPEACPWWGFHDPDVRSVLAAHDFYESGQLREFWGDDPPYWLVLGVQHYQRTLEKVRLDALRTQVENAKRAKPKLPTLPPGTVVDHVIRG